MLDFSSLNLNQLNFSQKVDIVSLPSRMEGLGKYVDS